MKRIIVLVLVLLLPCIAVAEQGDFQIEGEWYCTAMHTRMMCYNADLKEDGCYYVNLQDGEGIVFREQGQVDFIRAEERFDLLTKETHLETETETIITEYCRLSDGAILYYDVKENELSGYYICYTDDGWIVYLLDSAKMILFLNGKAIPYFDGDTFEYLVSGNSMYLTQGEQYVRGRIAQQGDKAFVFDIDADPWIVDYGEHEVNYGTPFYLFISTSIGK